MNTSTKLVSTLALLVMAATGCAVAPAGTDDAEGVGSAEDKLIKQAGTAVEIDHLAMDAASLEVRSGAEGQEISLKPGSGWSQVAPGVWEKVSASGASRLVTGLAGHQWAAAELEKEIAALHARAEASHAIDAALNEEILQKEQTLVDTNHALQAIGSAPLQALSVTCNVNQYDGIRSPVDGYIGAASIVSVACSGGVMLFTLSVRACGNGVCLQGSTTQWVGSSGYQYAALKSASSGCSATSSTSPGITVSWSGTCG